MCDSIHVLPCSIKWEISSYVPLIKNLPQEFIKHPPEAPVLRTYWTLILLLSFFRPADQQVFCDLHENPQHDGFLHALARFHIHYSEQGRGFMWLGGIGIRYSSMSDELSRLGIPSGSDGLKEFYEYYQELLHGK